MNGRENFANGRENFVNGREKTQNKSLKFPLSAVNTVEAANLTSNILLCRSATWGVCFDREKSKI